MAPPPHGRRSGYSPACIDAAAVSAVDLLVATASDTARAFNSLSTGRIYYQFYNDLFLTLCLTWGPLPGGPEGPWTPKNKIGGPVIGLNPPDF